MVIVKIRRNYIKRESMNYCLKSNKKRIKSKNWKKYLKLISKSFMNLNNKIFNCNAKQKLLKKLIPKKLTNFENL